MRLPTPAGPATVVDGVDYQVEPGEVFGIAGESGSGKTMSMLALMGLLPPGSVVEGRAASTARPAAAARARAAAVSGRELGMVFQDPMTSLHPMLSIGTQLTEHVRLHLGLEPQGAARRAEELLDEVRIPDPATALARVPAPVLGWDAPADRDRDRARLPAEAADRRRADDRARRDGAGRDHPAARPLRREQELSIVLITHDLGGAVVDRRPRGDLLRRPRRRVRLAGGRAPAPAASVHARLARRAPASRDAARAR